ncbi:MAG: hypothetical protein M1814_006384 [Vezdaea aestivalis]|nr:MAG: hypothetical protein M1814_006384 [Vezdaea aestivalis]
MPQISYASLPSPAAARDSLELASLASSASSDSTHSARASLSSSRSGISSSRKLSLENDQDPLSASNLARPNHDRLRSYSVSSAFDFSSALYPLTSTSAGTYAPLGAALPASSSDPSGSLSLERQKTLTYLNGLSLVVGLIIGSGIFSSPSQVNVNAGSPGASLIVWVVAGILAWTGAASYAELGGAIPLNGGAQVYLTKIFGELFGFLFTWCAVCVLKPGSAAIISIIFGEYVVRACVGAEVEHVSSWINKGVALLGLILVTLLNCLSTKLAARTNDFLMILKFAALLGVTIVGIVVAITGLSFSTPANSDWKTTPWFSGTSTSLSSWAVALYAGLWAFDGWDNVNYVVGEFKNPTRDLPRVIHTAMPAVIASYILANVSYFLVLPHDVIAKTNTVAVQFGSKVFGPLGALLLSLTVSLSCFGALNAATFTSGRLTYVAGKEGYLPEMFGTVGWSRDIEGRTRLQARWPMSILRPSRTTPVYALSLNALLTALYVLVGEFSTLLTFYGVAGYLFYFLTVLGVVVLRVREPALERPYKTWITTPIIFCCVSLFLLSRAVVAQPGQTGIVIAFVLVGIPVFWWRVGKRDGKSGRRGEGSGWKFWKRWGRS